MVMKAQNKKTRKPENQKTRKPENQKKTKNIFCGFLLVLLVLLVLFRLVLKGFPLTQHQPMQDLGHASSG